MTSSSGQPVTRSASPVYTFVVYPRHQSDIEAYVPGVPREDLEYLYSIGEITPGTIGESGRIMTLSYTADMLDLLGEDEWRNLFRRMRESAGTEWIALAGRLPALAIGNGIRIEPPFVLGDKGAIYTVTANLERLLLASNLSPEETRIAVIGQGYIGSRVVRRLQAFGYPNLVGFDPRFRSNYSRRGVYYTGDPNELSDCDVGIALTAQGPDLARFIPFLKEGVRILDDTHPEIPLELRTRIRAERGGRVYKAVLGLEGVYFRPAFPEFQEDWIMGCVAETLARVIGYSLQTQEESDRTFQGLGFEARCPLVQ